MYEYPAFRKRLTPLVLRFIQLEPNYRTRLRTSTPSTSGSSSGAQVPFLPLAPHRTLTGLTSRIHPGPNHQTCLRTTPSPFHFWLFL
jgi:hypothetical protein